MTCTHTFHAHNLLKLILDRLHVLHIRLRAFDLEGAGVEQLINCSLDVVVLLRFLVPVMDVR